MTPIDAPGATEQEREGIVNSRMGDRFDASASELGYLYQARYALLRAVTRSGKGAAGSVVIEGLDDVEFNQEGEPLELIQTKHRLRRSADLSDASVDLWKALRVWMERLAQGHVSLSDSSFLLVTTGKVSSASAASYLTDSASRDPGRAAEILAETAGNSSATTNQESYALFLGHTESEREEILSRVFVLPFQPNIAEVREEIEVALRWSVRRDYLTPLVDRLEGWWFREVVECLSALPSKPIELLRLEEQVQYISEQFKRENLPIDFRDLSMDSLSSEDQRKTFVEQLRLINLGTDRILHAVLDYYKAYNQRSRWLKDDLLRPGELGEYEQRLIAEWRRYFAMLKEEVSAEAVEDEKIRLGRQLYRWVEFDVELPIRRDCTEPYVWRGSFQMLADRGAVGWHPEFTTRLKELLEEAAS